MSTITQLRVPPIKDENAFEDFCRDLWELVWNDPNARRNGRRGQAQCGVDVYGIPDGADRYEGVQAKAVADPLTDAEIQDEIDQAKKFDPPLRRLIIATGAPRDANGQKYVRNVNLQHRKQYEAGLERPPDFRITCLFVDRDYRRSGVSGVALRGALDLIRAAGGGVVEAYPHDTGGKKKSSSFLYNGTRTLFEKAGFEYQRPKGPGNCVMVTTV